MVRKKNVIPLAVPVAPHVPDGIYVGIDQSLTGTGVAIFNADGYLLRTDLFGTKPGLTPLEEVERFISLFADVHNAVQKIVPFKPVCAVMEDFAFAQAHQMAKLGGLGWHFRIMMSRTNWHFATCPTTVLKQIACGKGNAQKDQIMLGVYKRWTFESSDNNIADAYVLGRIALMAYAKPLPGPATGVRKDDLASITKLTIYR